MFLIEIVVRTWGPLLEPEVYEDMKLHVSFRSPLISVALRGVLLRPLDVFGLERIQYY